MGIKTSKKNLVELAEMIFESYKPTSPRRTRSRTRKIRKKTVIKLQNCIDTSDVTNSIDGDFKLYNAQNKKTKNDSHIQCSTINKTDFSGG